MSINIGGTHIKQKQKGNGGINDISFYGEMPRASSTPTDGAGVPKERRVENSRINGDKIFIVHSMGENGTALKDALKNYLQNTLRFSEPVVLAEQSNGGQTIIEAFEREAKSVDLVFVLLTPDDPTDDLRCRARQNVIFELGYFLGKLGRNSGKVIVLVKGNVEIPSDLNGVFYIRISDSVEGSGEAIRKAVDTAMRGSSV